MLTGLTYNSQLRPAHSGDRAPMRALLWEVAQEGESLPFTEVSLDMIDSHWLSATACYVSVAPTGELDAMYRMGANMLGRGSHVATATFVVARNARRRGFGRLMLEHCLTQAQLAGYSAIQFNYVVESNTAALQLYQSKDFEIVGRLPGAFHHATLGQIDALVLFRSLRDF